MGARGSKRYRQKEEAEQQQQQQQGEAEEGPVAVDVEELERKYVAAMRAEAAAIVEAEVRQQQQQQQRQRQHQQQQRQQHHGTATSSSYLRFPTAAATAAASALLAGARAPSTPQPQADDTAAAAAALPRRRRLGEQGKRLSMPPTAAEIFERQYVAEARAAAAAAAEASRHRRPLGADPAPAPAAADEDAKEKDKEKERPSKLTKKFGSFRRHGRGSARDEDATARSRTEKRHSLGPLSSSSSSPVPLAAVRSSRSNPRMQAAGAPSSASPVPLGASGSAPVSSQSLAAPSPLLQTRAAGDGARPSSRGDAGSSSVPEPLHHMREPRSSSSSSSRPHSTSPSPSSAAPAEGSPRHRRQHSNESDKDGGGGGKKHRSGHSHRASKSSHHTTGGTGGGSSAASGTPVPTPPVEPLVQPLDLSAVATPGSSEQHQRQQPRHEEEKKKEGDEEEEVEEGPMLTVRGFKNYIAGMVPDASAATICEFVDTPQGVVERELSDTAPIPANINPQRFIVRGTSTLRISPPPPLPQAQSSAATTTTTTTTTTPVQQTGLEVREPPALPRSPLGATASATTGSSSEESDQPRRLAQRPQPAPRLAQQQRDNPRKMLKRQPSRFVTPYGDTQPYRLKKDAEASLTLVQVAHVRKGKHTCWTLAIEPACTAADLCVAVLEMSAGLPDETVDRAAIPATLYEVERTSGCTPATFSPETSEHADMVDMDERVLDRYNARPSAKKSQRIFVVHEDTKTRRLSAGLSALAADRVKKPIVVDRSDLHGSSGGDGDGDGEGRDVGDEGRGTPPAAAATPAALQTPMSPDSSYWVREDEITWVSKISSGSFARVYKGVYRGMLVAVKMLKGKLDEKVITEFRKEFKVLKSVRHENLIKCYGVCFEHNRLSYLFEYAERGTLVHVMMDPNVQFSWANVAEFFAQAARGLQFLHEGGPSEIIHRDLKSQNLLVTRDYRIKLSDFGLSRFNTVSNGTTLGNLCGTMSHAAPEVFTGERFTPKSDVYSMGMILWELSHRTATGSYSPPFKEFPYIHMDIQIIIQASQKHLRPTIPEATPEKLASLIRRCWDKDARSRPSASGILALLEEIPMERMGLSVADMSGEDAAAAAVVARVQQL